MKKFVLSIAVATSAFSYSAGAATDTIPVVGLLSDGSEVADEVPRQVYTDNLKKALVNVEQSTMQALAKKSDQKKKWMLRTVIIGIGINMEVKLGPIWKMGVLPRFRVIFSNAKDPAVT